MGIRSLSTASISTGTKRSKVWDQSAVVLTTAYESIATTILGSNQSSITFSSIPQGYKHLQLRFNARCTRSQYQGYVVTRFNSDSGSNYAFHSIEGDGTAPYSYGYTNQTSAGWYQIPGALAASQMFGSGVVDILDYNNTNKYTTTRALQGNDTSGTSTGRIYLYSALWMNTSAITSITFTMYNGEDIAANSHFALYGIKG